MDSIRNCRRRFIVDTRRSQYAFERAISSATKRKDKEIIACGLFVNIFSSYERAVADIFFNYALGNASIDGQIANRYVSPRDTVHAGSLLRGNQQVVFWADSGRVIERCDDWFIDGFKIGDALKGHKNTLDKSRKIRNYIAHGSNEAWVQFRGVWESDIGPAPPKPPHPGTFLIHRKGRATSPTFFEKYTSGIEAALNNACGYVAASVA